MANAISEARRERQREINRAWYWRNVEIQRDRCRIKSRHAYASDREKVLESYRKWWLRNKDSVRAQQREYYQKNKARRNAANRKYNQLKTATDQAFRLKHNLRGKQNYQKNKVRVLAKHKEWMRKHPGIQRVYSQNRRALEKKAAVNLRSIKEWVLGVKSKPLARCYYCESVVSTKHIHFDHIIPLIRGGCHSIENLCVSCVLCNLTKGTAKLDEWQREGQQLLNLI